MGESAKAEADKLVDKANKQVIYGRIDACLTEYDTLVRSCASTMAWFNSGRKKVREMVAAQATEIAQEKAAKVAKKKADKEVLVPETSDDEEDQESESESEESEPGGPLPGGHVCGAFQRLCL